MAIIRAQILPGPWLLLYQREGNSAPETSLRKPGQTARNLSTAASAVETTMSPLINFYRGTAPDSEGRMLQEIWAWSDQELEAVHDFIQWLFPLPEPSRFNPDAPLLTPEDVAAFRTDDRLRANLRRSFERILTFPGLAETPGGQVVEGPNFAARTPDVWSVPNHNWLRVTRILRSLS